MRVLLASLLLLAGCATQSAAPIQKADTISAAYSRLAGQYPHITERTRTGLGAMMRSKMGITDDSALDCMTASYLGDISDSDLSTVETAITTHYASPEYLLLATKLFGPSVIHGEPISISKYKDGTPRDLEAEHAADARIQGVARRLCPATLAKYPQAFGY